MAALHPIHRPNKARKLVVELLIKQGTMGENSTHQYAGEPFVVDNHGEIDVDTLVHELFKVLDPSRRSSCAARFGRAFIS